MFLTRRLATAGLITAGFVPPAAAQFEDLYAAARKEGAVTWYISQMTGEVAEMMGKRFSARYPGIAVTAIRTTGQVAYTRLQQELKNNTPQCDVYSSTDIAQYISLKGRNAIARYDAHNAGQLGPLFQGLGDPGYYYPATATLQVLACHATLVKPEDRPTRFLDLTDPKWRGRVAVGHPAFSAYFAQWALLMTQKHGPSFLEKLAANKPRIGRSGNDPIAAITGGEALIGTTPTSTATQFIRKGNPIVFIYPEDGAVLTVGPAAILASAPHPNAARLFLEWLLSPEFAAACAEVNIEPVRADAPPLEGTKPLSQVTLLSLKPDQMVKGLPEIVESWREIFGG